MKRNAYFSLILLGLTILILANCADNKDRKIYKLQKIKNVDGFTSINGYKVEKGKFYFTGIKNDEWDLYSLDLGDQSLANYHQNIESYDLYIALKDKRAIYIDLDSNLYYRKEGGDVKIDDGITGFNRPNLLISPSQDAILYTKKQDQTIGLYIYDLQEGQSLLVREGLSKEALKNFTFTSQWSKKGNYFIYNNEEIYNRGGQLQTRIQATASQWSPDDKYIVFIKKPGILQENKIIIGDWETYIGHELGLLHLPSQKEEIIYNSPPGLIDPIDNIQWSKSGKHVGISFGTILKSPHNELEGMDYQGVYIYDINGARGVEVGGLAYNYYEILFDNYLYASYLGKKSDLEIISIYGDRRWKYKRPVLLNSQDMFVISSDQIAYFVDDNRLMQILPGGQIQQVIKFPWQINELYFDEGSGKIIITTGDMEIYLLTP